MATKKKTEIETIQQSPLAVPTDAIPEHMQGDTGAGTEDMGRYKSQSRLGIAQSSSSSDRKEEWGGEGSVAITPDGLKVAGKGEDFTVIPVMFFPTWEAWNDYNDKGSEMVLETSFDPASDIAQRSRQKNLRVEAYGPEGQFKRKYMQCLNFMCYIESGDAVGEVAAITFRGGDHHIGKRLCSMLGRRTVPIYGNRLSLHTELRSFNDNEWFGFEINNPEDGAYVTDPALYEKVRAYHKEFSAAVAANKLTVDRSDEAGGSGEGEPGGDNLPPI